MSSIEHIKKKWQEAIIKTSHPNDSYNFSNTKNWFESLTVEDKLIFEDFLLEELIKRKSEADSFFVLSTSYELFTNRIQKLFLKRVNIAYKNKTLEDLDSMYLLSLAKIPKSKEILKLLLDLTKYNDQKVLKLVYLCLVKIYPEEYMECCFSEDSIKILSNVDLFLILSEVKKFYKRAFEEVLKSKIYNFSEDVKQKIISAKQVL